MAELIKKINYWLEANSGYGSPEAVGLLEEAIKKIKQFQAEIKRLEDKIDLSLLELAQIEGEKTPTETRVEQALKEK